MGWAINVNRLGFKRFTPMAHPMYQNSSGKEIENYLSLLYKIEAYFIK